MKLANSYRESNERKFESEKFFFGRGEKLLGGGDAIYLKEKL
jgi:hypothetical protein